MKDWEILYRVIQKSLITKRLSYWAIEKNVNFV